MNNNNNIHTTYIYSNKGPENMYVHINNVLKMKSLMNVECMNGFSVISRFDGDENSERNGKELHG